jgi:hypothetical protein
VRHVRHMRLMRLVRLMSLTRDSWDPPKVEPHPPSKKVEAHALNL